MIFIAIFLGVGLVGSLAIVACERSRGASGRARRWDELFLSRRGMGPRRGAFFLRRTDR